jgi:hypothetical protein
MLLSSSPNESSAGAYRSLFTFWSPSVNRENLRVSVDLDSYGPRRSAALTHFRLDNLTRFAPLVSCSSMSGASRRWRL